MDQNGNFTPIYSYCSLWKVHTDLDLAFELAEAVLLI